MAKRCIKCGNLIETGIRVCTECKFDVQANNQFFLFAVQNETLKSMSVINDKKTVKMLEEDFIHLAEKDQIAVHETITYLWQELKQLIKDIGDKHPNFSQIINWYLNGIEKGDAESFRKIAQAFQKDNSLLNTDENVRHYSLREGILLASEGKHCSETVRKCDVQSGEVIFWLERKDIKTLQSLADSGNVYAMKCLADRYRKGELVEGQDLDKAIMWYKKAYPGLMFRALSDEPLAVEYIADYYHLKLIVSGGPGEREEWRKKSVDLYRKTAESNRKNNVDAQVKIGECYRWGTVVNRDLTEAIKWLSGPADKNNHVVAQCVLADIYSDIISDLEGNQSYIMNDSKSKMINTPDCCKEADIQIYQDYFHKYSKLAADSGDSEGMYLLGCCIYNGFGAEENKKHAITLLERAAQLGDVNAQVELGQMSLENAEKEEANLEAMETANEIDFLKDITKRAISWHKMNAVHWYISAALLGHPKALAYLMTSTEIDEKERKEWENRALKASSLTMQGIANLYYICSIALGEGKEALQLSIQWEKYAKEAEKKEAAWISYLGRPTQY